jgi:hypothetical protein
MPSSGPGSPGTASLGTLLDTGPSACRGTPLDVPAIAERIAIGGWPMNHGRPLTPALQFVRDYLADVARTDIGRVDAVRRDPARVARLLRSLARNIGTPASVRLLAQETADPGTPAGAIKEETAQDYLTALARLMVVEDQPAWAPHLRSKSILSESAVRHFACPSLAVAALGASPAALLQDLRLLGFLFESLVIRDLRIHGQAHDAQVSHYRDNTGLEVDAIVHTAGGAWAAFEVKLGPAQIDTAAANLQRFAQRVDTRACGEPRTLGVIVPGEYGYVRPDGIAVIPIGALGP